MKFFIKVILLILVVGLGLAFGQEATNFSKVKTTHNPDLTGANGETWSNNPDGTWSAGGADIRSTGGDVYTSGGNVYSSNADGYLRADNLYLGYNGLYSIASKGSIRIPVYNVGVSGADITAYSVVVWDQAVKECAADTTKGVTARISNDIMFSAYAQVKVTRDNTGAIDTTFVSGTDPQGNAILDTLAFPNGSVTVMYSDHWYSDLTSITVFDGSASTFEFDAIYFNSVKACDGANADLAGVATAAIADSGGTGWLVTYGYATAMVDAKTLNAAQGTLLVGASGGDAVTIADATADSTVNGKVLGYAVQSSSEDNKATLIFVDKE